MNKQPLTFLEHLSIKTNGNVNIEKCGEVFILPEGTTWEVLTTKRESFDKISAQIKVNFLNKTGYILLIKENIATDHIAEYS